MPKPLASIDVQSLHSDDRPRSAYSGRSVRSFRSGARRGGTRARSYIVKPNNTAVYHEYNNRENLFENMYFGENFCSWESLAQNFVICLKNKNLKNFVSRVTNAKLEAERRMRKELDFRILSMREEKLRDLNGKEFVNRLKNYIRLYIEEEELALADKAAQNHRMIVNSS